MLLMDFHSELSNKNHHIPIQSHSDWWSSGFFHQLDDGTRVLIYFSGIQKQDWVSGAEDSWNMSSKQLCLSKILNSKKNTCLHQKIISTFHLPPSSCASSKMTFSFREFFPGRLLPTKISHGPISEARLKSRGCHRGHDEGQTFQGQHGIFFSQIRHLFWNKFAWKLPLSVGIFDYLIGVFQTWLYILIRIFCLEKSVEGITTNPMAHVNLGAPSDFCSAHFQPAPLKGPNFHPPRFGRKKVRLKLATGFFCR